LSPAVLEIQAYSCHEFDLSDVIGHVNVGQFLLVVLWNQLFNGFRDIQWRMWRNGWHDLDTTSKQRSGSFWYQSISHIRLPTDCQ